MIWRLHLNHFGPLPFSLELFCPMVSHLLNKIFLFHFKDKVKCLNYIFVCFCFRHEEPLCVNNINIRRGAPWSHDLVQVCGFY